MRKMFDLLMVRMPLGVMLALALLVRRAGAAHSRPMWQITLAEIVCRLQALDELLNLLPAPTGLGRLEMALYQQVLRWVNAEINALRVIQRLNVVVVGTVPYFPHTDSVAQERQQ